MVDYIDQHRDEFGVESICKVLQVAPSTYYAAKRREPSARAVRDAAMMQVLMVLWVANRKVYGAHKLWKAARRAGHDIGRDQVARLMRSMQIEGVGRQRRKVFTTRQDPDALRAPDLVNRNFTADRPDALWVTDLTYVPTGTGMAYVCFIVDAFSRRIVGWRVASNMRTEMVLDALEMARRSRGNRRLIGLVTHSDAGSQGGFNRRSQHLDDGGVVDEVDEQAEGRACVSWSDPVAGTADGGVAGGPGAVLVVDRRGRQDRGCCYRSEGVITGCVPVVPPRWWRESLSAPDGVGSFPVVR
jgi:putative transposase